MSQITAIHLITVKLIGLSVGGMYKEGRSKVTDRDRDALLWMAVGLTN